MSAFRPPALKRRNSEVMTSNGARGKRLRPLCDAYELEDRSQLLATICMRIQSQIELKYQRS